MSYKTILVHVDKARRTAEIVKLAGILAGSNEAHLVGLAATGVSRYAMPAGAELNDPFLLEHVEFMRQRAQLALKEFEKLAGQLDIAPVESRLAEDDAPAGLALHARYADLVVLGQTDPNEPFSPAVDDLPQFVVLNSGRPVLIVPYVGEFSGIRNHPLVAWDASPGAARAVTNALPLLKRSTRVDVAVINPGAHPGVHGQEPGADIALYLSRHGIKANVITRITHVAVGDALLSLAAELGSGLIVMGGYGTSRFREIMLGGATRTVLESMTVPVLMSH
jgi:nucleotide-binding universal stress UspA family protein